MLIQNHGKPCGDSLPPYQKRQDMAQEREKLCGSLAQSPSVDHVQLESPERVKRREKQRPGADCVNPRERNALWKNCRSKRQPRGQIKCRLRFLGEMSSS